MTRRAWWEWRPRDSRAAFATRAQVDDEVSGPRTMSLIGIIGAALALLLAGASLLHRRR